MRIFLSHSSRDKALVRELRSYFPAWVAPWLDEDRLLFGANLESSLRDTINNEVDYVVIFLGREAVKSEWVKRELSWALAKEKTINRTFVLPVILDEVDEYLDSLGVSGRITLSCVDQNKEAVRGLATKVIDQIAGWMATQFSSMVASSTRRTQFKEEATSKYEHLINSVIDSFTSIPAEWRIEVEGLVLKPLLRTSQKIREGKIPLDSGQYYQCILREIEAAGDGCEIFAISTLSSHLWSNNINQKNYLKRNMEAIQRGAEIKRLFVLPVGVDKEFRPIFQEQVRLGVKVRVADNRLLAQSSGLDDLVIFQSKDSVRVFVCYPAIDDPGRIRAGRMVIEHERCNDYLESFLNGWNSALDLDEYLRSSAMREDAALPGTPPGLSLPVQHLTSPVVTCAEAAAARGVKLSDELKTLILETSSGLIAAHLPGDAILSLRAVKDFLEAQEAYVADPETLLKIGLSPGTVSAILEPVWSMPHLISRRVFDAKRITTNNKTKTGYFSFDPVLLTQAKNVRVGDFEKTPALRHM